MRRLIRVVKQFSIVFMVILITLQMTRFNSIFAEGGTEKDIGNLMKIDPVSVTKIVGSEAKPIIEKGNKVANAPEVKVGDLLEFKYEFHVDETSLQQIKVGDYFYLNLPDGQHIKAIEGVHDITTPDGKLLGRYTIEDGKIKVIVAHLGIQDSGKSGWISFHGTVIKDGENVRIGTKGNTRLTIKPSENGNVNGGGGGHDSGKSQIGDDKIVFSKDGKQYIGKNIINWHLNVNYDGLRKMVNGEVVTKKSHVVLEDTLPAGVTVDLHSIYITTPLFVPTPDNKMSGFAVNYPRVHPEVIEPRADETYQQFYERIKNAGKLTVGVYHKNGEHKLLFGFGNLPGNGITYANILGNEAEFYKVIDDHVRSGNITSEQANRMKQVYGIQGTTQGAVVGYDVSFDTNVSGPSGNYENIAQLHWDEQNPDNAKTAVAFHRTEAGISENEKKITIKGTKIWEDKENQDGKRPDKIKVILNKTVDGKTTKAYEKEVAKDNWSYEFTNLPKYEGGKEITYSIDEEAVAGYEKTVDGYNLKNRYTPETVSIKGTKIWEDGENQDGKRPDKIKVLLNKTVDGKTTKASEKEVTKDNWSYEFTDLPKYEGGKEITYSIDEETVVGYEKEIQGYNLVNKYTPEKVSIKGTKTWGDKENQDGKRPDKIKVLLNKTVDGKTTKAGEKEVTKDNWSYEFTDLPKYEGGKEITYSIDEETVAGYEKEIQGYNLTNKHTPEVVTVKGTKTWEDKENQDGKRPDKIKVLLNKTVDGKTTKASEKEVTKDNWSYEFTDLPKYEGGKEVTYSIDEEAVAGYEKTVDGYNLKNRYTPETVSVKGTKTWEDKENQDGKRPDKIKVILNKTVDGKTTKAYEKEVTKDNWSYEFTELPKYEGGKEITYSIDEEAVVGYEKTVDGYNLKNRYTPETVSVKGTKTWEDKENQDGKRPDKIKVLLNKTVDGKTTKAGEKEVTKDNWSYEFTELPKYEGGKEIVYSIDEETVEGYEKEIKGYNLVNKYTPEKVSIKGTKIWEDGENRDGKRPDKIKVILNKTVDGKTTKAGEKEVTKDNWSYEFTDLPKYEGGKEITYKVIEAEVPLGYESKVEGYNIINKYKPEEPNEKPKPDPNPPGEDPKPDPNPPGEDPKPNPNPPGEDPKPNPNPPGEDLKSKIKEEPTNRKDELKEESKKVVLNTGIVTQSDTVLGIVFAMVGLGFLSKRRRNTMK